MQYFPEDLPYNPPNQPLNPELIYTSWKNAKVVLPRGDPLPLRCDWDDENIWMDELVWLEC